MQRAHLPLQGSPARPTVSTLQAENLAVPLQPSFACRWGRGRAVQGYCTISPTGYGSITSTEYLYCIMLQEKKKIRIEIWTVFSANFHTT